MKRVFLLFALAAALTAVSGCKDDPSSAGGPAEMKVAYIDTDELLVKWEKYRDFGDSYIKERNELLSSIAEKNKAQREKDRNFLMSAEDEEAIVKLDAKWTERKEVVTEEIRAAAKKVSSEQKLDLVLDNPSSAAIIEYGGSNITLDVLTVLKSGTENTSS